VHVLVVDDEALARAKLRSLLERPSAVAPVSVQRCVEAANGDHALIAAEGCPINLAFVDVQMPGMNGVALAQRLRQRHPDLAIVFVTAFENYAIDAFDVEAVDYLTKPVRAERLAQALERVARWLASRDADVGQDDAHLLVRDRGALVRVPLASVTYFKAEMKYTTVKTIDREFVIDTPLAELESHYPERFVRVHRNALVSIAAIMAVLRGPADDEGGEGWVVQLRGVSEMLPISRRQLAEVRAKVQR
jgi:two-component system response regulator AlgR